MEDCYKRNFESRSRSHGHKCEIFEPYLLSSLMESNGHLDIMIVFDNPNSLFEPNFFDFGLRSRSNVQMRFLDENACTFIKSISSFIVVGKESELRYYHTTR